MRKIDTNTEAAVRQFTALIEGKFSVAGVILFGSRARGTHDADSDADVAVLLDGVPQRLLPTALALTDLTVDVLLDTGINITPLPIWISEWDSPETHSNPALLANIAREGIWL